MEHEIHLYLNQGILFSSPTLVKADDGAAHGEIFGQ